MSERLSGERIGVIGLGRSGMAACRLALSEGASVYASDRSDSDAAADAARQVREMGGEAEAGRHDVEKLAGMDRIVLSPGIPPGIPPLRAEGVRQVPLISELEFAFQLLDAPVIAVTGTNGKTTVTALVSHLLEAAGYDAPAGGNIGLALSEIALRDPAPDVVAVEASSFQLGRIRDFRPRIGVLTNLSPDHLDWYDTVADYYADKARMFSTATAGSRWVLNAEDEGVVRMAEGHPGSRYWFRTDSVPEAGERGAFVDEGGRLVFRLDEGDDQILSNVEELPLLGRHNTANVLAAALAAGLFGASLDAMRGGLGGFRAPEHRFEPVGEWSGVLWINDSKATNVAAAQVAVRSVDRPTILLVGGKDKGEDFSPLAEAIRDSTVRRVLAFGEAAPRLERSLASAPPVERVEGDLRRVVARAAQLADHGDAVLLAPACSSFDMFRDFEERGTEFKRLAREVE